MDVTSNYPMEAKELPSIGLHSQALNCVIIIQLRDQIKKSGVPIVAIAENHSIEGIIEKVRCVATIIGKSEYADEILMENVYPKISELLTKKSRVSEKISSSGKAVSADGFISMIGGENSMNDFWKPVSTEAL